MTKAIFPPVSLFSFQLFRGVGDYVTIMIDNLVFVMLVSVVLIAAGGAVCGFRSRRQRYSNIMFNMRAHVVGQHCVLGLLG